MVVASGGGKSVGLRSADSTSADSAVARGPISNASPGDVAVGSVCSEWRASEVELASGRSVCGERMKIERWTVATDGHN